MPEKQNENPVEKSGDQSDEMSKLPDPVEALRKNNKEGVQSLIHYDKQDGKGASKRVIEPHSVATGLTGILVRAMEIEPQHGARHYKTDHIVEVEPHDVPLAAPRQHTTQLLPEIQLEPMSQLVVSVPGDYGANPKSIESSHGEPLPLESEGDGDREAIVPIVPWALQSPFERSGFNDYLDAVRDAVLDLVIETDERERLKAIRSEWGLSEGQMRAAHARVFAEYVMGYTNDGDIDTGEADHLHQLELCLEEVGWGPA